MAPEGSGKHTRWFQNPFLEGVSCVRLSSPLFFPPPHGVLRNTKWPNRYSNPVALRSVALGLPGSGGVSQENRATPPCSTYHFSSQRGCRTSNRLLEGVAVQGGVPTTLSPVVLQ